MNITLLSGGVGGARCALAIDHWRRAFRPEARLTAIVNVGDDFTHLGQRISPDIDSVTYHLGHLGDRVRGWGRDGDTTTIAGQVSRHLPDEAWFHLGDLDLGHSLIRTELLKRGLALSAVTRRFVEDFGIDAQILPVTDDPSPTVVHFPGGSTLGFQEWWVRERAEPLPSGFTFPGAATAAPAPGVLAAITEADLVVIAPSNPIVSIAPMLAIPGVEAALRRTPAPVVGLSPIIGGRPVRGWADRCLEAAGIVCSALAVRDHYGDRASGGLLDAWLVDTADAETAKLPAVTTVSLPLLFRGDQRDAVMIDTLVTLAGRLRAPSTPG